MQYPLFPRPASRIPRPASRALPLCVGIFVSGLGWACVNRWDIAAIAFIARLVVTGMGIASLAVAVGSDCRPGDPYCVEDSANGWPLLISAALWLLFPVLSAMALWLTQRRRLVSRPG